MGGTCIRTQDKMDYMHVHVLYRIFDYMYENNGINYALTGAATMQQIAPVTNLNYRQLGFHTIICNIDTMYW